MDWNTQIQAEIADLRKSRSILHAAATRAFHAGQLIEAIDYKSRSLDCNVRIASKKNELWTLTLQAYLPKSGQ